MSVPAIGNQTLIDLYDCDRETLNSIDLLRQIALEAARLAGATIVNENFHRFSPHGVSGVVILAESHLTIHTWPEHGFAAVDLFTCGAKMPTEASRLYLMDALRAGSDRTTTISRGDIRASE